MAELAAEHIALNRMYCRMNRTLCRHEHGVAEQGTIQSAEQLESVIDVLGGSSVPVIRSIEEELVSDL